MSEPMSQTTTPSGADVLALPTLPHPMLMPPLDNGDYQRGYDAEDMQEYAREAVTDAVAALIARNAELEAERDELDKKVSLALRLVHIWESRAIKAEAAKSALAADNLALREVREAADRLQSKLPQAIAESRYHARAELRDLRAALARTPAKENGDV